MLTLKEYDVFYITIFILNIKNKSQVSLKKTIVKGIIIQ